MADPQSRTDPDDDDALARSHQERTDEILAEASRRDDAAEARDARSDAREKVADLEAFLGPDEVYHGLEQRREAAADRSLAKSDRRASAQDRLDLTEQDPQDEDPDANRGGR